MMILILAVLLMVVIYMSIVFVIAWWQRRLDVVDIAWGGAFIVAALSSFAWGEPGWLQYVVTGLVIVWGVRLSTSILKRFLVSTKEDARYTEMRQRWKSHPVLRSYGQIFLVQACLATLISLSVIVVNLSYVHDISVSAFIGIAVWLVGFLFESIGDAQLRRHLANPKNKGKLMTSGLWRYTRHPNYFGEATQWWGIFIIALSVPYGWLTIVAPLTITALVLLISGVPLTERHFEGRPGWKEYKHRTSVFIPLPPRSK
jgi:steroid 5-alpha reductase family enzyme